MGVVHPLPESPAGFEPWDLKFLMPFPGMHPNAAIITWRFPMSVNGVILTPKASPTSLDDWTSGSWLDSRVDFISQNVQPLSNLTITLRCARQAGFQTRGLRYPRWVVRPLRELHERGFRLRTYLSIFLQIEIIGSMSLWRGASLERLAMGEGYHPTEEELEFHRLAEDLSHLTI